jgi:hypothetical protein
MWKRAKKESTASFSIPYLPGISKGIDSSLLDYGSLVLHNAGHKLMSEEVVEGEAKQMKTNFSVI